jgi:hypothetical protein
VISTLISGGTTRHGEARGRADGAETPLALGNAPFTTVIAGSMASPKIPAGIGDSWTHAGPEYPVTTVTIAALGPKLPPYTGDSWRLVTASVLGAVPLAVASAVLGRASAAGGASGMSSPPTLVLPAQHGVMVAAGALARPKWPLAFGD